MTGPSVMSIDDHDVVQAGLERAVNAAGLSWLGSLSRLEGAAEQIHVLDPDVVLLDLYLGGVEAWATCTEIVQSSPRTAVAVYSSYGNAGLLDQAMRRGARGYLLKSTRLAAIPAAILSLAEGNDYWDPGLLAHWTREFRRAGPPSIFSPQELRVVALIAEGMDNYAIAEQLGISSHTVKYHIAGALRRTGERNRAGLVRRALADHVLPT